jgi:multisubunit Na+/H+ antiporter MnhG subunit
MFLVAGLSGVVFLVGAGYAAAFLPGTLAREQTATKAVLIGIGIICAGTVVCFTAWRKLGTGGKGARGWAIAASVLLILVGWTSPRGRTMWWIAGVGGLIVFSLKRGSVSAIVVRKPARMAGDGTSGVLDWVGTAVIYAGVIVGSSLWST